MAWSRPLNCAPDLATWPRVEGQWARTSPRSPRIHFHQSPPLPLSLTGINIPSSASISHLPLLPIALDVSGSLAPTPQVTLHYTIPIGPVGMASRDSCECGKWRSKGGNSTRAYTAHLRVCTLRETKATSSSSKRRATEIDTGEPGETLAPAEPPQKTLRRSVCRTAMSTFISW